MKPSWLIVEYASTRLMSGWTNATVAGEQRGERADPRDDGHRVAARLEERVRAGDDEHAGRHHRRGVDQRGDRRRAFHRVGQPEVQRELRALADRAEEAGAARSRSRCSRGQVLRRAQRRVVERADRREDQEHRDHEAEVADTRS